MHGADSDMAAATGNRDGSCVGSVSAALLSFMDNRRKPNAVNRLGICYSGERADWHAARRGNTLIRFDSGGSNGNAERHATVRPKGCLRQQDGARHPVFKGRRRYDRRGLQGTWSRSLEQMQRRLPAQADRRLRRMAEIERLHRRNRRRRAGPCKPHASETASSRSANAASNYGMARPCALCACRIGNCGQNRISPVTAARCSRSPPSVSYCAPDNSRFRIASDRSDRGAGGPRCAPRGDPRPAGRPHQRSVNSRRSTTPKAVAHAGGATDIVFRSFGRESKLREAVVAPQRLHFHACRSPQRGVSAKASLNLAVGARCHCSPSRSDRTPPSSRPNAASSVRPRNSKAEAAIGVVDADIGQGKPPGLLHRHRHHRIDRRLPKRLWRVPPLLSVSTVYEPSRPSRAFHVSTVSPAIASTPSSVDTRPKPTSPSNAQPKGSTIAISRRLPAEAIHMRGTAAFR